MCKAFQSNQTVKKFKTQHNKNPTPIYKNRVKFTKQNDTKTTKFQYVEPEIYDFLKTYEKSAKKINTN